MTRRLQVNCRQDFRGKWSSPYQYIDTTRKAIDCARGGIEPWLMARWKARVEFLLSVIELPFLSLTVEVP